MKRGVTCEKCGEDDWYPRKDSPGSFRCRECRREYMAKYRRENREHLREYHRQWREENLDSEEERRRSRETEWERQGIDLTESEYQEMLQQQNGVCAICLGPPRGRWGTRLVVDHDHETGEVRGLLCDPCNKSIGQLKHSPEVLRRAAEYLDD